MWHLRCLQQVIASERRPAEEVQALRHSSLHVVPKHRGTHDHWLFLVPELWARCEGRQLLTYDNYTRPARATATAATMKGLMKGLLTLIALKDSSRDSTGGRPSASTAKVPLCCRCPSATTMEFSAAQQYSHDILSVFELNPHQLAPVRLSATS